jgi:beta-aspartyl-peptidase (threonine type)
MLTVVASENGKVGLPSSWKALLDGATALDAVEAGVRAVEDNPDEHSVGYAGHPNIDGARILASIWMLPDGTPPTAVEARLAARATHEVLRRMGAIAEQRHPRRFGVVPTPGGVLFARAALQTWRSGS